MLMLQIITSPLFLFRLLNMDQKKKKQNLLRKLYSHFISDLETGRAKLDGLKFVVT